LLTVLSSLFVQQNKISSSSSHRSIVALRFHIAYRPGLCTVDYTVGHCIGHYTSHFYSYFLIRNYSHFTRQMSNVKNIYRWRRMSRVRTSNRRRRLLLLLLLLLLLVPFSGDLIKKPNGLSTLETIVADIGNSGRFWRQSPNWATIVASVNRPFGDNRRFWQQSPNSATVAELGDYSRQWATIVASVDRP